jgi:hypothetical protein
MNPAHSGEHKEPKRGSHWNHGSPALRPNRLTPPAPAPSSYATDPPIDGPYCGSRLSPTGSPIAKKQRKD